MRRARLTLLLGFLIIIIVIIGVVVYFAAYNPRSNQTGTNGTQPPTGTSAPTGTTTQQPTGPSKYPANIEFDEPGTYAYGSYNTASISNPNVGGVVINFSWGAVEPQQGTLNFGPADHEIASWVAAGKKIVFQIRFLSQKGNNASTVSDCSTANGPDDLPPWEVARIPHLCDTTHNMIIPDYFNSTFQADAQAYVKAIAQHYANSPYRSSIIYVRIATGTGGEQNLLMGCRFETCHSSYVSYVQQLQSWGYTPTALINYDQTMLSAYKAAFNYTTVIYAISQPIPEIGRLNINPATGNMVFVDVAQWAAANGIGLGQMGLNPNPSYPAGGGLDQLISNILAKYPNTYIQFQTVGPVTSAADVQGDIANATQLHGRSIEWYEQDINNLSYQPYFAQWQQTVNSR
jgi:hypothetical protein